MKKTITLIASIVLMMSVSKAQYLADFEDLTLVTDSFYLDSASTPFESGQIIFNHDWTYSPWGDYWSNGFSYSNMTDSVTSGFGNQYSAKAAKGHNGSANYIVGQSASIVKFYIVGWDFYSQGVYVTNATYTYNSMRDGDMFGKKFGGPSGNDPDWFKLNIRRYYNGILQNDSIEFYLADFRFSDNSQDYIVKTWEYVDLSTFTGFADSLQFSVSSSDVGAFGMNTPAYFCLDDLVISPIIIGLNENKTSLSNVNLSPTIVDNTATLSITSKATEEATISVLNYLGQIVKTESVQLKAGKNSFSNNYAELTSGIYFISVNTANSVNTLKFVKN
ncbi:MAG: DUF4465 domain-containing protein [Bacteroidetes bacterium]|nr:DUF4465 domain-containing protein [Bacteroidota bacterium]